MTFAVPLCECGHTIEEHDCDFELGEDRILVTGPCEEDCDCEDYKWGNDFTIMEVTDV